MNPADLLKLSRQSFAEFWAVRDARERGMLSAAAAVVLLGLIYALLIAPALTGREQLNENLPVLRQQVAQLQTLSRQATAFSGLAAPKVAAISREYLEAALASKGLKPQSLIFTGDYVKVQFTAVSFANTLNWLNEMQKSALLSVVDANIVALSQPDMVNVSLTLRQTRNE